MGYIVTQDLYMNGDIKGILKVQRQYDTRDGASLNSKLTVVFLVEVSPGKPHLGKATAIKHWLTDDQIAQDSSALIEVSAVQLLKSASEKLKSGEGICPCELLECVNFGGRRKIVEKRRESEQLGDRPQLVRAKSLEDQMLSQAGYGPEGEHRLYL